jgi:hypothetical protein
MISRSVLVLLVGCGCGCGGGGDGDGDDITKFVAVYATTSHTRAEVQGGKVGCADPGQPVAGATPYFQLAVDTFFMNPDLLGITNCNDAAATSCTETLVTLHAGGPGLENQSANANTGGGAACQLYFHRAEATLTGTTIKIDVLDKYDAPNISSSDCTLARAEALATASDCRSVEHWTGTRQ